MLAQLSSKAIWLRRAITARQALVLALLGSLAGISAAQESPPEKITIEYTPPELPGDPVILRYIVPPGWLSALVLMRETLEPVPDAAHFADAIVLDVPVNPDTGEAILVATVPLSVTVEQMQNARLDFRVFFMDNATSIVRLSERIPFFTESAPAEPEETADDEPSADDDEDEGSAGPGGPSLGTADAIEDPQAGQENATASTGSSGTGSWSGKTGKTKTQTIKLLDNVSILVAIHDQPTPIQGSGH